MKVLRVECKIDRKGFYRSNVSNSFNRRISYAVQSNPELRAQNPAPAHDGLSSDKFSYTHSRFGFKDWSQLVAWFKVFWTDDLEKEFSESNFEVIELSARNEGAQLLGHQVCYDCRGSRILKRYPVSEITNKIKALEAEKEV